MFIGLFQVISMMSVIVIFFMIEMVLMMRYASLRESEDSGLNWPDLAVTFVLMFIFLGQPAVLPQLGLNIEASWALGLQLFGVMLTLLSLGLYTWSRFHLQEFYVQRAEIQTKHRVINTGPYQFVRHPIYTAYFLMVAGYLLITPALTTVLVATYTVWYFGGMAKEEEQLLSAHLPRYVEYMTWTGRFFPRLVSGELVKQNEPSRVI